MESRKGFIRSRKQVLKPIATRIDKKGEQREGDQEEPLSPSARIFHDPNFNLNILAILGCKTKIDPKVVKANLGHTLLKHPRFSSLQVTEKEEMKWVPTEVDLESHVIVIVPELDPNMDSPDKFLEDYVFNLTKTPIDKSRPLWDLHLLNLRTSQSEAVGIFRIHHSLGDGTSLMSLLLACTRQMNDPLALPTLPTKKKYEKLQKDGRGLCRIMLMFWSVFQVFWNTLVDVFMFVATVLTFLKDTQSPLKGPQGAAPTPRRIIFKTVSLDDIKLVKNAMNTTINDVVLGVIQAGLSRYIKRICGMNKKIGGATEMDDVLAKNSRLRAILFFNIRPSAGIQALADMMEKDAESKWGNKIGYVLLPFTIAIRDDPLDYVRDAKATVDRKKRSFEAIYTYSIAALVLKLFGFKAAGTMTHKIMSSTTLCFSNMVGPLEEIGFYGHPMAFLASTCYGQPHALMISFQSYIDKMSIVLSVDEGTIRNPHQLGDDIVDSLQLIKDAVLTRGLT